MLSSALLVLPLLSLAQTLAEQEQQNESEPTAHNNSATPEVTVTAAIDQQPDARTKHKKEQNCWWNKFIEWTARNDKAVVAISTVVIAAFTFALFVATLLLWCATSKLVEGSEEIGKRQLRAYVSVTKGYVSHFAEAAPLETNLVIRNAGKTPAYDFSVMATVNVHPASNKEFPTFPAKGSSSRGILGPRMKAYVTRFTAKPLSDTTHKGIISGDLAISVYGELHYRDAFGEKQWTKFRFSFLGDGTVPNAPFALNAAPEGNEGT